MGGGLLATEEILRWAFWKVLANLLALYGPYGEENPHSDVWGREGADSLYGVANSLSADTIFGFGGDDYINAYQGNDVIDAGWGNDVIRGGQGWMI